MDGFKFYQPKFHPVVPSVFVNRRDTEESARIIGDVGIKFTKINSFETKVKRWSFFFSLNYFKDPLQKQTANNSSFDNSELFGRIIHPHMLQSVTKLSTINPDEMSYVMTLESR